MILSGWKEIAAYLRCGVRTVQRWEKLGEAPIHRLSPGKRSQVVAYSEELDEWVRGRKAVPDKVIILRGRGQELREESRIARNELRVQVQCLMQQISNLQKQTTRAAVVRETIH